MNQNERILLIVMKLDTIQREVEQGAWDSMMALPDLTRMQVKDIQHDLEALKEP